MPKNPAPQREAFSYYLDVDTRWDDNDTYGHLNNTVHYRLFDTAVNRYLLEHDLVDFRKGTQIYLVVETGCSYFAELAYPDLLSVGITVEHLGRSSVRYRTGLFKKGADQAAAAGYFVHVHVDRTSRKPIPIEGRSRALFEKLMIS